MIALLTIVQWGYRSKIHNVILAHTDTVEMGSFSIVRVLVGGGERSPYNNYSERQILQGSHDFVIPPSNTRKFK